MPPIKRKGHILCSGTPNRNGMSFTDHLEDMVKKWNDDFQKSPVHFMVDLNDPNIPLATRKAIKFGAEYGAGLMCFEDMLQCVGNCDTCEKLDTCTKKPKGW